MSKRVKAPRSSEFPTGGRTARYLLDLIPDPPGPDVFSWRNVRAKATAERISLRTLILTLLRLWFTGQVQLPAEGVDASE